MMPMLRTKKPAPESMAHAETEKLRVHVLVHSARASAKTSLMEQLIEHGSEPARTSEEFKQLHAEVECILRDVEQHPAASIDAISEAYSQALAVAYSANGRACHLARQFRRAIDYFEMSKRQLQRLPEPHIGIAASLFKLKYRGDVQWVERAEAELNMALEFNGASAKAFYYLGKLELERGRPVEAKAFFQKSDPHPWTLFHIARIVADEEKDGKAALKILDHSFRLLNRADGRSFAYGLWTLRLIRQQQHTEAMVKKARAHLAGLVNAGAGGLSERARGLLEKIDAALAEPQPPADPPPQTPEPPDIADTSTISGHENDPQH